MSKKPVVIDLEPTKSKPKKTKKITPADAPPVPEIGYGQKTNAMETVTNMAAYKPSRLARFFWLVVVALIGFVVSVAFWDFVTGLLARNIWLGRAAFVLMVLFVLCVLFFTLRELVAFARLKRMDDLRKRADQILSDHNLKEAKDFSKRLKKLYNNRADLRWAFDRVSDQEKDILDADGLMGLMENTVVTELDKQAVSHIETSSRQVATATAIIPLALADVVVALGANVKMIRRIAEVYGGRSGTFGSWRLMRAVAGHLVATGAVAIGDDMIGSIAGGGVLSKLSRRFGEGIINGALTARVGLAAIEVCRPMPFTVTQKPSVTMIMKSALSGFFVK